MSLRSDDLDSVGELYTEDEFRQLVVVIEVGSTVDAEEHDYEGTGMVAKGGFNDEGYFSVQS